MRTKELFEFIQERYSIFVKKEAGDSKPWTSNLILQKYSFCNIHRENDTVTKWVAKHWVKNNAKDPHLWFAMVVARFINWPDTMAELGYPDIQDSGRKKYTSWDAFEEGFLNVVLQRQQAGQQVYGGAYTISTNGRAMPKHEYLSDHVFKPLWDGRGEIEKVLTTPRVKLAAVHETLCNFQGMGSFMAAQVIADLKHAQLKKAPDWWTFAASGPGSRRGLNRVCSTPLNKSWREEEWKETLDILHEAISGMVAAAEIPQLDAQNLQNSLCEFDKLERVRLGEGRPRSLYPGI